MSTCLEASLSTIQAHPEIYIVCTASERKGISHGIWINATQKFKDIMVQIEEMLAKSPIVGAKTFLIRDYRGFGSFEIDKCEDIEHHVCIKALLVLKFGGLASSLFAYYNQELDDTVLALTHHYVGAYQSERDFALRLFNQSYLKNPDNEIEPYVNYNQFRKDIFERDYFSVRVEGNSHIFVRH